MGATLGSLVNEVQVALDVVSRELVGFIPAVTLDPGVERAAIGQTVRSFVAPAVAAENITAAHTVPDDGDQTIGSITMSITKARRVPIRWTGEEALAANNSVPGGAAGIRQAQVQQAIRTLVNEVEADLAGLHLYASRAYGAAATTPFGTAGDYTAASNARRILVDNGSPTGDISLVVDTGAGANIRGKQGGYDASNANSSILRQGVLLDINGMAIRESGQVKTFTAGSFTTGTLTSAVRAVGATALAATADYTAGLAAGDVITLAHESGANKYVITAVAAGTITIAAPGLRTATAATGTVAITLIASTVRNMAFSRSAIMLATRLPALPAEGDLAIDRTTITDPRSGIAFELSMYPGFRQMKYELMLAWGVKMVKTEHCALLLG